MFDEYEFMNTNYNLSRFLRPCQEHTLMGPLLITYLPMHSPQVLVNPRKYRDGWAWHLITENLAFEGTIVLEWLSREICHDIEAQTQLHLTLVFRRGLQQPQTFFRTGAQKCTEKG